MKTYRVSALASGFVRMWRGWTVIVPVVVITAVLQALLVWPAFTYGTSWWAVVAAVISAVVQGIAFGLVGATALQVADGPVRWTQALGMLRGNLGRYALWAVAWLVAVSVGLSLYTVPGLVVAALTPFLLLAVLDGQRNPIAANFATIGRRFWRWLVTTALVGLAMLVGDLAAGLFTFFTRVPLAAIVVWLVAGFVLTWFTTAWALIYRDAWAEPATAIEPARPESAPADQSATT